MLATGPSQDRHTTDNEAAPEAVGMRPLDGVRVEGDEVSVTLPPLSWAVAPLHVI